MPTMHDPQGSPADALGLARQLKVVDPADPVPLHGPEIRVLIAHGEKLARAGLEALLAGEPGISVVGSAADAGEAVERAEQAQPDVLVVDADLPGGDGLEVARRLQADSDTSAIQVLMLGRSERDEEVFATLRAGARGLMSREVEPADLADGVRALAAGEAALSPDVVRRMIAEITSQPDPSLPAPEALDELTPREREVMGLVAAGLSNDEIAEHLVISRATAKTHVSRTLLKLHARNRAQLVTLAYETGLVLPKRQALPQPVLSPPALAVV